MNQKSAIFIRKMNKRCVLRKKLPILHVFHCFLKLRHLAPDPTGSSKVYRNWENSKILWIRKVSRNRESSKILWIRKVSRNRESNPDLYVLTNTERLCFDKYSLVFNWILM